MTPRAWQNLAIAATITFYLILLGSVYFGFGMCKKSAVDFCAYWVSGKIINSDGFADIYDLEIQREFQMKYFEFSRDPSAQTYSIMYPPLFMMTF